MKSNKIFIQRPGHNPVQVTEHVFGLMGSKTIFKRVKVKKPKAPTPPTTPTPTTENKL